VRRWRKRNPAVVIRSDHRDRRRLRDFFLDGLGYGGISDGGLGGLLIDLSEDGADAVADGFTTGSAYGAAGGDGSELGYTLRKNGR